MNKATKPLTHYKALTFDCYGTLIDWESGIWDALQPLLHYNHCTTVDRQHGLATFAVAETHQQQQTPNMLYPDILVQVHQAIAQQLNLSTTPQLDQQFGHSLPHWPAFSDAADALRQLKKQFKLVVLSNVHRDGFAQSNKKLGVEFDAIYTAQDVGSYKPDSRNFTHLITQLKKEFNLAPSDILHTAQSQHHDHVPATEHGLATAWIDRQRLSQGGSWGATHPVPQTAKTDFIYWTLAEMAQSVNREQ